MKNFIKRLPASIFCLLITCMVFSQTPNSDSKVLELIKKMTLEEKISMLHANGIFTTAGIQRLGIPGLSTDDGPLGIREDLDPKGGWASANLTTDSATFFPNGSALAATWNPALAKRMGIAIGEEARARNKDILLAPAFNICRTPVNGRTYEYYSEDPLLNAKLAVQAVQGLQSQHIAACVKHYALNNQETNRDSVDVLVSERALREIYLPAFKAAIEEGEAWTIMSAYNKFRGTWCSENAFLLKQILRDEWKFKGAVISDWGGTHSTLAAANNGLDVEMGSGLNYEKYFFAKPLLDAVKAGQVSEGIIDEKVKHILYVLYQTALYPSRPAGSINTPGHSKLVYDVAAESIVLLNNAKQLLPLKQGTYKRIAVIGDNAVHRFQSEGFGAGVKARYEVTALEGMQKVYGKSSIVFAQGYRALLHRDIASKNLDAGQPDPDMITEAVAAAKSCEAAILFIGGNRDFESESRDRKDLALPFGQQALVEAVTAANANTIVVITGGAPYDLKTIKKNNQTVIFSWYNGSENGNVIADVICGKINPSGKLPFTFPSKLEESPAHSMHTFPGENGQTKYDEGILIGYRWFDTKNIEPLYPFGYGLSYTNFEYNNLQTGKKEYQLNETIQVSLQVKNAGKITGKETVQLYVSKTGSKVERANKELKAFTKMEIAAGASSTIKLQVPVKDLAYFDEESHTWIVEPGSYQLLAGSSSRDIRQQAVVEVR